MLVVFAAADEMVGVLGAEWDRPRTRSAAVLVGIGKGIAFFTGPVLFAASRPRFRAVMLWILAIVSTARSSCVGAALTASRRSRIRSPGWRLRGRSCSSPSSSR